MSVPNLDVVASLVAFDPRVHAVRLDRTVPPRIHSLGSALSSSPFERLDALLDGGVLLEQVPDEARSLLELVDRRQLLESTHHRPCPDGASGVLVSLALEKEAERSLNEHERKYQRDWEEDGDRERIGRTEEFEHPCEKHPDGENGNE